MENTPDDIKKLIAEALIANPPWDESLVVDLIRDLAAALEAEHETAEERFRILVTVTNNAMRFSAERDALRTAIQPVLDAWNIPGIRPDYHASMVFALKREWPTLYSALSNLSRAIDTKEK